MRRRERDRERRADSDAELQGRFVNEIARLFPGCPAGRAEAIARHTSLRGSGRVGRSAAGRSLDEKAITLAVEASVRHEDTNYDSLLMSGVPGKVARERIRAAIERVLGACASRDPFIAAKRREAASGAEGHGSGRGSVGDGRFAPIT